ncbi:UTP--glucose-1-phosphate uridylyltransferase [Pumilibacter muris]|uniref:UTP--glucose-1-phosphate uridylyltransferase n=1 Tax=Pumilibacter muris TaxID=2941510 RepID=UPI00203C2BD3|nr:UTP--glucose-1-phosphate uridylyltransferase [Pumilibacter muris]
MTEITKAVIPCGGMGTRFLPVTKAVPKEILPVVDTPVLAYIVNEAIDSGITDIMIVLGRGKEAIREYFSPNPELEDALEKAGKIEFLQTVKRTYSRANIVFAEQPRPLGSGDAVMRARSFTGDAPFALAWGDDLVYSEIPVMKQLADAYEKTGKSVLGVQTVNTDDIVKYGVARVGASDGRTYDCLSVVEKPPLSELPSRLAALGRYVLTSEIYDEILKVKPSANGEIQFTDALNSMCEKGKVCAYDFIGRRYDMGDKFGATVAALEYGLRSPVFGVRLKNYLKELLETK